MRRFLALATVALSLASFAAPAAAPTRCTEDMPCWDCHTMGNQLCGPTTEG